MQDGISGMAQFVPWIIAAISLVVAALAIMRGGSGDVARLLNREADERARDAEYQRAHLADVERVLSSRMDQLRLETNDRLGDLTRRVGQDQAEGRVLLSEALREMAQTQNMQIERIRAAVNEQLHGAVEKQMQTSFQRVVEQFSAMQKALGEVTNVTAQIGDLKRLFSNVKTRGGWGEAQCRAILDDVLPEGSYDTNFRLGDGGESVEFAIRMPVKGHVAPRLAIDSKFPTEAYERLLNATELSDANAEKAARKELEATMKLEARKIASKYICPPITVEFAVLYLPTDGLYTEIARMPGVIDEIGRLYRVIVMGPSLLPAMLRTVHLGYVTLALEERTEAIATLLGATRQEMLRMDQVLDRLQRNAGTMGNTIEEARRRTRVLGRRLRALDGVENLEDTQDDLDLPEV
ncbi:DNA recombination protein RmuC [Gluconobacter thailandicus]|uniref:DNA recombination protein RmuC homolog n=1 Tax=Gluconobacter thailandicus TaxID=257438 RepID=A0AAP9JH78_GLUTH|nr:DNA recombination protein RmuC [Gluconobacter thailandicus]QEH95104.1 DNA recombination protein RmuC [Gluconobacter thailandicus]